MSPCAVHKGLLAAAVMHAGFAVFDCLICDCLIVTCGRDCRMCDCLIYVTVLYDCLICSTQAADGGSGDARGP